MDNKQICQALILGIKDYFEKNSVKNAVIGLSGGVDSAVCCCLIAKAIGSENVMAILMPEEGLTSDANVNDAKELADKLKIDYKILPINNAIDFFTDMNQRLSLMDSTHAIANAKARIRMTILYYFANLLRSLVIGTSDKSEIALGYTTKYGDNASDLLVIGDLWKTDVIKLGRFLSVPERILKKMPSADLILNVSAEEDLGAKYDLLDKILRMYIEEDVSIEEIIRKGYDKKIVENVVQRIVANEHKRRSPIIVRVSNRSFHNIEWRMPITNKFISKDF
jgi:NAD+ synthase (glutamine-hydrolysing)